MNRRRKVERVLVAGGSGFLGRALKRRFAGSRRRLQFAGHERYDLTKLEDCIRATKSADVVIHAAGIVSSRRDQEMRPAEIFRTNSMLTFSLLEACRLNKVPKIVLVSSQRAYAQDLGSPLRETELLAGLVPRIQGAVGFYGLSKWLAVPAGLSYSLQYGMKVRTVVFPNLYGPGDKFDDPIPPLVPNLIQGVYRAKMEKSGSFSAGRNPGAQVDLLYVEDACDMMTRVLDRFGDEPFLAVNAGAGRSYALKEVCRTIARACGFEGRVVWEDQGSGPPSFLDNSVAKARYGWRPKTLLPEGIRATVRDYLKNHIHEKK